MYPDLKALRKAQKEMEDHNNDANDDNNDDNKDDDSTIPDSIFYDPDMFDIDFLIQRRKKK